MKTLEKDTRPWGGYEVLADEDYCKVKRIFVLPGKRLSYQKHSKRSEHWVVVKGEAIVTLDGKEHTVKANESIYIEKEIPHRMENRTTEDLFFIEVQTGNYFGEDDIVRLEDDYNRV